MWRVIIAPFWVFGRLILLGLGYLLFAGGVILFAALFFSNAASRDKRLVEARAVVTERVEMCGIHGGRVIRPAMACPLLEREAAQNPEAFTKAHWRRSTEVAVTFRTVAGKDVTVRRVVSDIDLPPTVAVGERVGLKYDPQRPDHVASIYAGSWSRFLTHLAIVAGLLSAAFVCWTAGGGWRVMTRVTQRETRANVALVTLVVWLVGVVFALLARREQGSGRRGRSGPYAQAREK